MPQPFSFSKRERKTLAKKKEISFFFVMHGNFFLKKKRAKKLFQPSEW